VLLHGARLGSPIVCRYSNRVTLHDESTAYGLLDIDGSLSSALAPTSQLDRAHRFGTFLHQTVPDCSVSFASLPPTTFLRGPVYIVLVSVGKGGEPQRME
jgi:hypothetical protein